MVYAQENGREVALPFFLSLVGYRSPVVSFLLGVASLWMLSFPLFGFYLHWMLIGEQ